MKYLKTFNEVIKVPIKVGDTILGGRFKNKKVVVKKIGKNDKGDITINGKPLLKYRIVKESDSYDELKDNVEDYLAHLKDNGFKVETEKVTSMDNFYIRIWKAKDSSHSYHYSNCLDFDWLEIEDEINRFIFIALEDWNLDYLYVIKDNSDDSFMRKQFTVDELISLPGDFKIKSLMIGLKKKI